MKRNFKENKGIGYSFSKNISENYLAIISNLFYLTMKKSSQHIHKLWLEDMKNEVKSQQEYLKLVRESYVKNLESTRNEIINFFGIEDDSLISARNLLRVYTHSLPVGHKVTKEYHRFNELLNKIEKNMAICIFPKEFFNEEHELDNIPKREIRDLES